MKIYKFYDTSSLLVKADTLFEETDVIVISSVTLDELEFISHNSNKDPAMRLAARKVLDLLGEHIGDYEVHIGRAKMLEPIIKAGLEVMTETEILASAIDYDNTQHPDETVFITNNLALFYIANLFFGTDSIEYVKE